MRFYKHLTCRP